MFQIVSGNIVRRLTAHFCRNRAFCDTSLGFGTELQWPITAYLRMGPQLDFANYGCGGHLSKWPPWCFQLSYFFIKNNFVRSFCSYSNVFLIKEYQNDISCNKKIVDHFVFQNGRHFGLKCKVFSIYFVKKMIATLFFILYGFIHYKKNFHIVPVPNELMPFAEQNKLNRNHVQYCPCTVSRLHILIISDQDNVTCIRHTCTWLVRFSAFKTSLTSLAAPAFDDNTTCSTSRRESHPFDAPKCSGWVPNPTEVR